MKTAMQELIEKLEAMISNGGDADLVAAKYHAEQLLNYEKKLIMIAYDDGFYNSSNGTLREKNTDSKEYYNETFKQ